MKLKKKTGIARKASPARKRKAVKAKVIKSTTPAAARAAKKPVRKAMRKAPRKTVAKKTAPPPPAILREGDTPPPPPLHGPGQRYALGPEAPPAHLLQGEPGELPEAYGTKRLLLTARDPHWVYAHWDFTPAQQRHFNKLSAEGHLVVRVYIQAITGTPHTEIHVHPESRNWFVHVGKGGTRYVAQIGYYDSKGKWVAISESKATMTPPDALSEDTTVRLATLPAEVPFEQLLEVVKAAAREHLPLAQAIQEITQECAEAVAIVGQESEKPAKKPAPGAEAGLGEWTPEKERALAKIISMDAVRRVWIGSLDITELVRRRLARELASFAAAQIPPGLLGSISSPFGGEQAPKGFWFKVNAELIIYGATEPDAQVTIGNRPIQLRPDGSFSYRFALPDGQFDLPIQAVAADQSDRRAAELKFSRQTDYRGEVGAHPQDAALKPPLPENAL